METPEPKLTAPAQKHTYHTVIRMLIADAQAAIKLGNFEFAAERLRDAARFLEGPNQ